MVKKFLRRTWSRYTKLGKGNKKKQSWNRPKGRDNKMREKRRGYPVVVSIGYKQSSSVKKNIFTVRNTNDLNKIGKGDIVVLGKLGKKKKIEILKKAKEMKIDFQNIKSEKFLAKIKSEGEKKTPEKGIKEKDSKDKQKIKDVKNESK